IEKMIELLKSENKTVRTAAVRNLTKVINTKNPEVVRALLPWLENREWAKEYARERADIVSALQSIEMPESVPGLIAVLNEMEMVQTAATTNANTNTQVYVGNVNPSANTSLKQVETFQYRYGAIPALAKQKDARAATALRALLPQVDDWQRTSLVGAILASNGFSVQEQIDA